MTVATPLDWGKLRNEFLREWKQGEHLAVIGPTGVGKTTLLAQIIGARKYVVMFVTKNRDKTISGDFPGFKRIPQWPPPRTWDERLLLWPDTSSLTIRESQKKQHDIFKDAMDRLYHTGNWCVVFDEQQYLCEDLGLAVENRMLQHQGRSSGITVVNGAQRPANVPVVTYSGSTHVVLWKNTEPLDVKRLSNIGGVDKRELANEMATLSKHEFVYINTRKGSVIRSQVRK